MNGVKEITIPTETLNSFTFELTPNEYRKLGNLLVRVAIDAKKALNRSYSDADDMANYRDSVLMMELLGISEDELPEV